MSRIKYLFLSIIFLVAAIMAWAIYRWMDKDFMPFKIPKITSDLRIEGVHLTRAVAGRTEWEIKARTADYFREKGITYLESPEAVFYGQDDMKVELKGDKGEVYNETNDVIVSGNVKVITSAGYTFNTDSLRYNSKENIVETRSKVFFKGEGLEIEGLGMSADTGSGKVVINSDVTAILRGGSTIAGTAIR